jgi:hypothetical protein
MNKRLFFTGGEPKIRYDQILFTSEATREFIQKFHGYFDDDYILSGCVLSGSTVSEGYVVIGSEVIKVDEHEKTNTHFEIVTTYDPDGDKVFNNGIARQTLQIKRATVTASSGTLEFSTARRWWDLVTYLIANYSTEQFASANIPNLDASKITTGSLGVDRIPGLPASKISSGVLDLARTPDYPASKVTSGTFNEARIPQPDFVEAYRGTRDDVFMTPEDVRRASERNLYVWNTNSLSFLLEDQYSIVQITSSVTSGDLRLPNPANSWSQGRQIRIYSSGGNGIQIKQYNGTNIVSSFNSFYYLILECIGSSWVNVYYQTIPIACPFIYINNVFVDEILKNQWFEENYKVDTIDVTNSVNVGRNILKLTEEKEEITYIDYLHVIIDGKVSKKLFTERRVMETGTEYTFVFDVPENYNKVEISAKGYYIPL